MSIIIQGGRIIDPARGIDAIGDVFVEGGSIVKQRPNGPDVNVFDATGLWVCPGLIDAHVHLREPGQEAKEDIESGLRAAAAGGFTAVLAMPNTSPPNDSPDITAMMISKAKKLGGTKLYTVAAATKGRQGREVGDLPALKAAGAIAFSDDGSAVADSAIADVLRLCGELDMIFSEHAEDPAIVLGGVIHDGEISRRLNVKGWPSEGEDRIVGRDIALAEKLGASLHIQHVSTRGAVQAIRQAKARGIHVTAEVAPHHLILTDEIAITKGTLAKVNPPLRPKENLDACIEGLLDGTLDIIATDHAPHTAADKGRDFDKAAFGMVGLETAVPLMLLLVERGLLTPMRMIEAMSTLPARIFRLPGGTLIPGTIADITLIDPKAEHVIDSSTFLSKSRNTPFDGTKVPGCAVGIVVGGNLILNHCEGSAR